MAGLKIPVEVKDPIMWEHFNRSYLERDMGVARHRSCDGFFVSTMNAAEEIVKLWLEERGYFLQSSIQLSGRREIDILAIDPKPRGKKLHIEVSVSIHPFPDAPSATVLADKIYKRKFVYKDKSVDMEKAVRALFAGKNYERQFVVGKLAFKNHDTREKFIKKLEARHVKVLKFEDVLDDVSHHLGNHHHLNSIAKAVQLCTTFLIRANTNETHT